MQVVAGVQVFNVNAARARQCSCLFGTGVDADSGASKAPEASALSTTAASPPAPKSTAAAGTGGSECAVVAHAVSEIVASAMPRERHARPSVTRVARAGQAEGAAARRIRFRVCGGIDLEFKISRFR